MQPNGRSRWHSSPHTIGRSSEKSQGRAAAASTPTKQSYSDHTPKNRTIQRTRRGGMALEGISSQDRAWSTTFWTLSLSLTHSLTHFLSINLSLLSLEAASDVLCIHSPRRKAQGPFAFRLLASFSVAGRPDQAEPGYGEPTG